MGSSVATGPGADAAGPASRLNVSSSAAGSMNTRCVSGPRYSARPVADGITGRRGEADSVICSTAAPERWVTGSKARISSISSPKKSSR